MTGETGPYILYKVNIQVYEIVLLLICYVGSR